VDQARVHNLLRFSTGVLLCSRQMYLSFSKPASIKLQSG
jgi:hypothetical protein